MNIPTDFSTIKLYDFPSIKLYIGGYRRNSSTDIIEIMDSASERIFRIVVNNFIDVTKNVYTNTTTKSNSKDPSAHTQKRKLK
jgi:hypothetical protein